MQLYIFACAGLSLLSFSTNRESSVHLFGNHALHLSRGLLPVINQTVLRLEVRLLIAWGRSAT